jgi:predicted transcriptional regulator
LPNISGSELKILAAVLYNYLQTGGGEPTSLTDIEHLTGLSRPTVTTTLDRLIASQVLERQAQGQSYIYMPVVKFINQSERQLVKKFYQLQPKLVKNFYQLEPQLVKNFNQLESESDESERELINNLRFKDSLSDSLNSESSKKILLVQKLRSCGVYLKTAQAIVNQHDEAAIEQQLKYYRYALSTNMAQSPGWLVAAINEDWPAPLGYEDDEENKYRSCPECSGPKRKGGGFYHNSGCPDDKEIG